MLSISVILDERMAVREPWTIAKLQAHWTQERLG